MLGARIDIIGCLQSRDFNDAQNADGGQEVNFLHKESVTET